MRRTIETAPRDGNIIILKDDARGTYDVARWSPEAGEWVGENGEPSKITPTHWRPMPGEQSLLSLLQEVESSTPSQAGPSTSAASEVIAPHSGAMAAPATVKEFECLMPRDKSLLSLLQEVESSTPSQAGPSASAASEVIAPRSGAMAAPAWW